MVWEDGEMYICVSSCLLYGPLLQKLFARHVKYK